MTYAFGVNPQVQSGGPLAQSRPQKVRGHGQPVELGGLKFHVTASEKELAHVRVRSAASLPSQDKNGKVVASVNYRKFSTLRDRAVSREVRSRALKWSLGGVLLGGATLVVALKLGLLAAAFSNPVTAAIVVGGAALAAIVYGIVAAVHSLQGGQQVRRKWDKAAARTIRNYEFNGLRMAARAKNLEKTLDDVQTDYELKGLKMAERAKNLEKKLGEVRADYELKGRNMAERVKKLDKELGEVRTNLVTLKQGIRELELDPNVKLDTINKNVLGVYDAIDKLTENAGSKNDQTEVLTALESASKQLGNVAAALNGVREHGFQSQIIDLQAGLSQAQQIFTGNADSGHQSQ